MILFYWRTPNILTGRVWEVLSKRKRIRIQLQAVYSSGYMRWSLSMGTPTGSFGAVLPENSRSLHVTRTWDNAVAVRTCVVRNTHQRSDCLGRPQVLVALCTELSPLADTCVSLGILVYSQAFTPTIILLSDCRKPEVFDICNKLMLGKDIGIISVISYDKHITGKHSQNWEGVARSPPAERDHTRSIMCFPFCKLQEDVIKIVRTKLPSQSSII